MKRLTKGRRRKLPTEDAPTGSNLRPAFVNAPSKLTGVTKCGSREKDHWSAGLESLRGSRTEFGPGTIVGGFTETETGPVGAEEETGA